MPLICPNKGESREDFIKRFMSNETSKSDFKNNIQRLAVAFSQWKNCKK